jgi:GT2 family glycosyltransferase
MKLTIVIVNYNVRYFLEQCLLSVDKAVVGIDAEIYVVDNNSVDGSADLVREKFPHVKLIANKENTGFSKANNQAMRLALGEYILLLNPDTVVEEDTFHKVIQFMDAHPDAGGLGVKMVDGKGRFLPESKRGLPTPETAFYKIFGISAIFPGSSRFNRYYLGHLGNDEVHEIEILSGAFMFLRRHALDKVGLLDEAFFMYGEDIDLSWRIIKGGWKNYYYPLTRIIHYKGESTKRGSLNYVFVFYNAMVIFARKHFSERNAKLFSFFIHFAIWLRAGVAVAMRFARRAWLPLLDVALTGAGLFVVKNYYADSQNKIYDPQLVTFAFSGYILVWVIMSWLGGSYDKPVKPQKIFKPILLGSAIILMVYSLLPEDLRFSRALILLGTLIVLFVFFFDRILYNLLISGESGLASRRARRCAVVGKLDEIDRVNSILRAGQSEPGYIVPVSVNVDSAGYVGYVGNISQLDEIVRVHDLDQVVFCARDLTSIEIISTMGQISGNDVEFKIAPPESLYIIGSNSIETSGDMFMLDVNSVSLQRNRRNKRLFDILVTIILLIVSPLMWIVVEDYGEFFRNLIRVLSGKSSWVGFARKSQQDSGLPKLRHGVLHPLSHLPASSHTSDNIQKLNIVYAKDYRISRDLMLMLRARKFLGNIPGKVLAV